MTDRLQLEVIDRREFVLGASAAALVAALVPLTVRDAAAQAKQAKPTWQDAMKQAIGDGQPSEGRVSLELPQIAENGNTVPFTVTIDSPMTDKDYVKAVHVFATKNPRPDVASFYFTPSSGKALATSRMRLGTTQDVVAVAEMSDGKFYIGKRTVKVTIGGCGG